MAYVEIYKLNNDGTQKVIAVCKLEDQGVVCEGEESFVRHLTTEGIEDYSVVPLETILPSEGRRFLEQLKYNFKSGYLNASDIFED